MTDPSPSTMQTKSTKPRRPHRREKFGRIGFSVAEAAMMMGKRADALRREIERRAEDEGDERVARLVAGIVARKRKGRGNRWLVVVPAALRT